MGELRVSSALGQPLSAEIELIAAEDAVVDDIRVTLADAVTFDNAGVDRPYFLNQLSFQAVRDAQGEAKIIVSTQFAVQEPFLHFIVQLTGRGGSVFREYALLLDPPDYAVKSPAPANGGVITQAATEERASRLYGPVRPSETLWVIAEKIRPDTDHTVEQMMMALQRANPHAFLESNVNLLRVGAMLTIPQPAEIGQIPPDAAQRQFQRQNAAWRVAVRESVFQSPPQREVATAVNTTPAASPSTVALETEEKGILRVVTTGREWLLSTESRPGKEVYPVTLAEQLQEEVVDSRQDLAAVNEINQDLRDLKLALESQIETLRTALQEKDEAIAVLQQQLETARMTTPEGAGDNSAIAPALQPSSPGAVDAPPLQQLAEEESGETGSFWQDGRGLIAIAIVLFGGLGILAVVFLKKRLQNQAGPETDILGSAGHYETDDPSSTGQTDYLEDIFDEDKGLAEEGGLTADAEPELATNYQEPPAGVAAVLTEADIYLAYRRYTQAENLIRDAMKNSPDDASLMAKLLEVYAFKKDKKLYGSYLSQTGDAIQAHSADLWEGVLDMTRDLVPEHPVLQADQLSSTYQEMLDLDDSSLMPEIDQNDPDITVDDLIVDGDEELPPEATDSNQRPSADGQGVSSDNKADSESAEAAFDFENALEDELIEHEIFGLDIDYDFDEDEHPSSGKKPKS